MKPLTCSACCGCDRFAARLTASFELSMTTIRQDDVIQSVADALQYISYYHSPDFIQAMAAA